MGILQQASGTFTGNGTFTPTLPGASSASNLVVVIVAGNTTVATPSGWTLRTSQVNWMGHYLFDRAGGSASYNFTANGQLNWWIVEIESGSFVSAPAGQNNTATGTTYSTQTVTPTAGDRIILASLGSLTAGGNVRTLSGWTNSFTEQSDTCQASADYPMMGVAKLEVTANGSTAYSTTGTYSLTSTGRSALIAAYATSSGTVSVAAVVASVSSVAALVPDVYVDILVTGGGPAAATMLALAPTVSGQSVNNANVGAVVAPITALAPVPAVIGQAVVVAPVAAITALAPVPSVTSSANVGAVVAAFTAAAPIPVVTTGIGVIAVVGTLTVAAPTPVVTSTATVAAVVAAATVTAPVPGVVGGVTAQVIAVAATGSLVAPAPVVTASSTVTPPSSGVMFTAPAPFLVEVDSTVTAPAATIITSSPPPVVSAGVEVFSVTSLVPVTAPAPAVASTVTIAAPVATVITLADPPALVVGSMILAVRALVTAAAVAPVLSTTATVAVPAAQLTVNIPAPFVSQVYWDVLLRAAELPARWSVRGLR